MIINTRRAFIKCVTLLLTGAGKVFGGSLRRLVTNRQEELAGEKARRLGVGTVELSGPESVEVYSHQTWTLRYTAGPGGIRPGGGLRIALRHLQNWHATMPQFKAPAAEGYLTATCDNGASADVSIPRLQHEYFAWQNLVQIIVGERGLKAGDTLTVVFGDRCGGGPGWRVQPFDETHYAFKCYVDLLGNSEYLPIEESPTVELVAAKPSKLTVIVPSDAVAGQSTWCLVRAEDQFGNPAPSYRGTIRFSSTDPDAQLPASYTFASDDQGVVRLDSILLGQDGDHIITVTDGNLTAESNPVRVAANPPSMKTFWGDLHTHTLHSDGRGTVEQAYDFAKRVAGLDFAAVSDHAFEIVDEMWEHNKRVTQQLNEPGRFVTMNAFEWSGTTNVGGDHNVYFLGNDPPIYRSPLMYSPKNYQMDHKAPKVEHVTELFRLLRNNFQRGMVFCIPHWGGRRGNPEWHDDRVQRLIEVYSEHRRSEDWVSTYLAAGHRVGIMASGDNHSGNPGHGCLKPTHLWDTQELGMALVAVEAEELTREAIFKALYERRVYATSGARIRLDLQVGGQPMGSEIQTKQAPAILVDVTGTDEIERVEVKRNCQTIHADEPAACCATLKCTDPQFDPDTSCFYYVRVVQRDGEEAISSPVWVN